MTEDLARASPPLLCWKKHHYDIPFSFPFLSPNTNSVPMAGKMSRPSLALLRSLRHIPPSRQCTRQLPIGGRRALHTSPKSFSNEEKSFRGQLYESTARRIQAQREAEARFASMTPDSGFARNSAFTFGMPASVAETFAADFCSNPLLLHLRLLVRNYET